MCTTCGCGNEAGVRVTLLGEPHRAHEHEHGPRTHEHEHAEDHGAGRTIELGQRVLAKNDQLAEDNRRWLHENQVLAVNLMSSPGSGKTTLLERTIRDVGAELAISVIEGDQETPLDAERVQAAGRPVVQVNTGAGCHLDASMVRRALDALSPARGSTVFIENVGNLVCPALFDLGEAHRVVVASVTEGADKPLKYPQMFASATLVLVNKVDLAPYVDFDFANFVAAVHLVNPGVKVMALSATKGDGLAEWYEWSRAARP